jgi:hypothetical protein
MYLLPRSHDVSGANRQAWQAAPCSVTPSRTGWCSTQSGSDAQSLASSRVARCVCRATGARRERQVRREFPRCPKQRCREGYPPLGRILLRDPERKSFLVCWQLSSHIRLQTASSAHERKSVEARTDSRKVRETLHGANGISTCQIRMAMSCHSRVRFNSLSTNAWSRRSSKMDLWRSGAELQSRSEKAHKAGRRCDGVLQSSD